MPKSVLVTEYVERVRFENADFDFKASRAAAQNISPVSNGDKEDPFNEVRSRIFKFVGLLLNHFVEFEPLLLGVVDINQLLKNLVQLHPVARVDRRCSTTRTYITAIGNAD